MKSPSKQNNKSRLSGNVGIQGADDVDNLDPTTFS